MSTLRDGASPSDKARKLVAELVEVSDKYHNGTHAKSWQIWAVNEIANALAAAPSLHKEGAGGEPKWECTCKGRFNKPAIWHADDDCPIHGEKREKS